MTPFYTMRGMGDAATTAANGAAMTGTILGSLAAPAVGVLPASLAVAGPIGAAAAAAIVVAMQIANLFKGCGARCTITTRYANEAEPLMRQNVNAYLAAPVRTKKLQAAYLNNFDTLWAALRQSCGNPQLADAGQRCISDRQAGACVWRSATPGGWANGKYTPAGPAVSEGGTCWNWFLAYRDPIANDPYVVPDDSPLTSAGADVLSAVGVDSSVKVFGIPAGALVLPAGLLLLALVFMKD